LNVLSNSFGTAKVIRERNVAWDIWLQCLPITWKWLLHSGSFLSERRLTLDTETAAGILPLTVPRDLDKKELNLLPIEAESQFLLTCSTAKLAAL
jgi:hypothetical protein